MKIISEYDVRLPDYSLSYLINNDDSGLDDNDKEIIDDYMQQYYNEAEENNGHVIIDLPDNFESYFTGYPEFGLACNVVDAKILILV